MWQLTWLQDVSGGLQRTYRHSVALLTFAEIPVLKDLCSVSWSHGLRFYAKDFSWFVVENFSLVGSI